MRSKINTVIILISILLLIFLTLEGIEIGEFKLLSISDLIAKNDDLNNRIEQVTELTSIKYPENVQTLEETYERYKIQKQKYEELSNFTNETDKEIYETKQYDISYLWRVLGKYAENRNLILGIDVKKDNTGTSSYSLNFTVSGEYTKIIKFITDIENDSDLYFRIYNFNMSGNGGNIVSTFTVKNVNIDPSTIS